MWKCAEGERNDHFTQELKDTEVEMFISNSDQVYLLKELVRTSSAYKYRQTLDCMDISGYLQTTELIPKIATCITHQNLIHLIKLLVNMK